MDAVFIRDGIVDVVILNVDEAPEGAVLVERDIVFAGWRYEGGEFFPPEPTPEPPTALGSISDRQFFQALAMQPFAIITPQEALDAVKTGEIPPVMQTVIDAMDPEAQFAATMILAGGTTYDRDHPLVDAFGASQGMSAAEIDGFWQFAQGL